MKIRYKRSGGLANITTRLEIDSQNLPEEKAKALRKLVEDARVFDQPEGGKLEGVTSDELQHDLEIEEGGQSHRICRYDSQCSPELTSLFDHLHQEAISRIRRKDSG